MTQPDSGNAFLGAGLAFPLALDADGRLAINALDDHVRQSIGLIIETAPGERVMRPDFGAGLQDLVFEPVSASTAALVQHEVQEALILNEPRIDVLGVTVTADPTEPGLLRIDLSYRVRATDTMFNLVYPFYLERSGP
ncbi:MAG TPA: GPW/gp25 family protein [Streptosporangiaceae bacterium]|nr:GPW/gp25 family protein [Streptosporangiaceae bacterium]